MRRLVVALGLTALTALPARAQEPEVVPRLLVEINNMIGRIEEQRTTIDSLLALPADSGLVARVDSLQSVLTAERAQHDLLVDSLEVVIADLRDEPPDTTTDPPQPTTVALTALPDTMAVGDTAAVTGALLDELGAAISTPAAEWNVQITGSLRFAGYSGMTNFVRAAVPGPGGVRYTHLPSGLEAEETTQVRAPPDTTAEAVAATVPSVQHVLLVGDAVTVRPNLIDAVGGVVPTTASEWDVDFDPAYLTVSGTFLVTAVASTPGGSETVIAYRHPGTQLQAEVDVVVLPDEDPNPPGPIERPDPVPGWPLNEPAGMTPLVRVDGSTLDWGAGWSPSNGWKSDRDRVVVVADPTSKYGRAIEKRGLVGDGSNWQGALNVGNRLMDVREVYIRFVFRLSPNFQFHRSGTNKLFYWGKQIAPSQSPTQYYVRMGAGNIGLISQASTPGGTHLGESLASVNFIANGFGGATRDKYHTVEVIHRMNSAPGVADGYFRMFYDGTEVRDYNWLGKSSLNNVVLSEPTVEWIDNSGGNVWPNMRFTGGEFFLFWGGQDDTKQVNDWIRVSELYVSGKN